MYARPPQHVSLAAILASPHPTIDLRLKSFEKSSQLFLEAVTNYTRLAIEEITKRRDAETSRIQKDAEKKKTMEVQISECKEKEVELLQVLEREQCEKKDAESSVAALTRQLDSVRKKGEVVNEEIVQVTASIQALRNERKTETHALQKQSNQQKPQLQALESKLCFSVEGVQKDMLLFRFTHIDPADLDRAFSIVVDVSSHEYRVPTASPMPPSLPYLLAELNRTREFFRFIKKVRGAFVEMARGRQ